jgi:hypothetical protein
MIRRMTYMASSGCESGISRAGQTTSASCALSCDGVAYKTETKN